MSFKEFQEATFVMLTEFDARQSPITNSDYK